ncbi:HYES hydrolase, partial [Phainopepla nitens]|nr:HYES hydrolase [Phainopepla nitens]
GFRTGLLTDTWLDDGLGRVLTAALLERLQRSFDLVLESCRLGLAKPQPGLFSRALQDLRAQPREV